MTTNYSFDDTSGFTAAEKKEIIAELNLLFSIMEGTVPMARGFGLDPDILDNGFSDGGNEISAEIIDKAEAMDSRISVVKCEFEYNLEGTIKANVCIERSGET